MDSFLKRLEILVKMQMRSDGERDISLSEDDQLTLDAVKVSYDFIMIRAMFRHKTLKL